MDPSLGSVRSGDEGMKSVPGKKLTLFTREERRYGHRPLYEAVAEELHRAGVRNVAVTRGQAGFGSSGNVSTTSIEVLAVGLPVVVEATDSPERIDRALTRVLEMVEDGVVEVMPVRIALGPDLPARESVRSDD